MKNNEVKDYSVIKGLCTFVMYFVLSSMSTPLLKLFHVNVYDMSMTAQQIYLISYNILVAAIFLFAYKNDIKKEWIDFKKNYKKYFKENIKYWLFALAIMYASNFIIAIIKYQTTGNISTAENEEVIRQTLIQAPFYTFIAAAFLAPVIEEMTFRNSLRKVFRSDVLFVIISSLIFGGLHVLTENVTALDLLYLIPYCAPGFAFAIILVKTKNIFSTMSLHLLHNTILMTLQVILLTRGLL